MWNRSDFSLEWPLEVAQRKWLENAMQVPARLPPPDSCIFPPFPHPLVFLPLPPSLRVPDFLRPSLTSATTCLCNHTAEKGHGLPHQEVMQIITNATPPPPSSVPSTRLDQRFKKRNAQPDFASFLIANALAI